MAVLLMTACSGTGTPARHPVDWSVIGHHQMILVVTSDPEGGPRTTRLWIVAVDESGYLRSSDTAWSRDLERDPEFSLIADAVSYPVSATRVPYETREHARVMAGFAEKYGLLGRTVLRFYSLIGRYSGPSDAKIFRLTARAPSG